MLVSEDTEGVYDLYSIRDETDEPTQLTVYLNEFAIKMILDTGASLSIINQVTFHELQQHSPDILLASSIARLQMYTGEPIPILEIFFYFVFF